MKKRYIVVRCFIVFVLAMATGSLVVLAVQRWNMFYGIQAILLSIAKFLVIMMGLDSDSNEK